MKFKKLLFVLALTVSLPLSAQNKTPSVAQGILVPATPPCPEIDGEMDAALANADAQAVDFGEILAEAEAPSENGCLPSLENIGRMINGSVPNFSMAGILTQIKEAACKEMDKAIERSLSKYQLVAKAPYGLGHVKVGVGATGEGDEEWIPDNGKSVFDPVAREAIKMGGDVAKEAVGNVTEELPNTEGVNRTIKETTNETTDEYKDNVNSARGAINDL